MITLLILRESARPRGGATAAIREGGAVSWILRGCRMRPMIGAPRDAHTRRGQGACSASATIAAMKRVLIVKDLQDIPSWPAEVVREACPGSAVIAESLRELVNP